MIPKKEAVGILTCLLLSVRFCSAVLPEKVLVGRASHCDDGSVRSAVEAGVNVVVWTSINWSPNLRFSDETRTSLRRLDETEAALDTTLDLACIQRQIDDLKDFSLNHLVSFGGRNSPHFGSTLSSEEIYNAWKQDFGDVFHGIDWAFEGSDNVASPNNFFTLDTLHRMGQISQFAKDDGYIVSMTPPQSYLDFSSREFSRFVNHTTFEQRWHSDTSYPHSANVYAYLLARYQVSVDLVSIRLDEPYSRAAFTITQLDVDAATYLEAYVDDLALRGEQFFVDFSQDASVEMEGQHVRLPLSKLVIGLANGWAKTKDETLFVEATDVQKAYNRLVKKGRTPRGFMFSSIDQEGTEGVFMASELYQVLSVS